MTDFNQKTHDTDVGSHGGQSRQMMKVFENQEFGSIRLLQEAGKTFFCASDVAKALGYVNPYAAVKRHCRGPLTKREGVVQKVNQYGDAGEQVVEISFITEGDGSYENVLLSDTEYGKLRQEFPGDYQMRVERLSEYMASTGRSYKNHLATIRSWAKREKPKYNPADYTFEEGDSL